MSVSATFENYLKEILEKQPDCRCREAMAYSLLNPGKRLRPRLLWSITNSFGADFQEAITAAAIVEMIHCYSLIHDDLPGMDNDDLRRGKASCHLAFDEATAILAGDGLLTLAFALIGALQPRHISKALNSISDKVGISGMILGQDYDMNKKADSFESYTEMVRLKTGCLFAASLMLAAIISDHEEFLEVLEEVGYLFGIAFQIRDDLLENPENLELNKSLSDERNEKASITALLGKDAAVAKFRETLTALDLALEALPRRFPALEELTQEFLDRSLL